jgi:hypothetical protein
VLRKIGEYSDDLPECLGVVGEIMFQSDVGGRRLNQEIRAIDPARRVDLAHDAVAAIFRIQSAARKARLQDFVPHLGQNRAWIENMVFSADALARFSQGRSRMIDREAICERIDHPGRQFVKWDCRSGNAALDDDGKLRWFDFEYSGARHGAEDIAWLIGDEAWPLPPEVMQQIVVDCFDPACGHTLGDYLDYLALYLTFHCVQRLKLITKEARKRGWQPKRRVLKYDDAGVHPEFAANICRVGRFFAARNRVTAAVAHDFEEAEKLFLGILLDGLNLAKASA